MYITLIQGAIIHSFNIKNKKNLESQYFVSVFYSSKNSIMISEYMASSFVSTAMTEASVRVIS